MVNEPSVCLLSKTLNGEIRSNTNLGQFGLDEKNEKDLKKYMSTEKQKNFVSPSYSLRWLPTVKIEMLKCSQW